MVVLNKKEEDFERKLTEEDEQIEVDRDSNYRFSKQTVGSFDNKKRSSTELLSFQHKVG